MAKGHICHSVLIVEDHPIVREGLFRLLDNEGDLRVVGVAVDASTAMHSLSEVSPDLAIVDISLGRESGLDLIRGIRSSHPRTAILVLSMHDDSVFAERALRSGARGYVNKREIPEVLTTAIRRVLAGEVWLSGRASTVVLQGVIGPSRAPARSTRLTERELEVLRLLGGGVGTREIAQRLVVSVKTVESHRAHLKEKLALRTSTELVAYAARWVGDAVLGEGKDE